MNKAFPLLKKLLAVFLAAAALLGCSFGSNNRNTNGLNPSISERNNTDGIKASALIGHTFEYQYDDSAYRAETTFYDSYFIDEVFENGRAYSSERGEIIWQGSDFTCDFEDGSSIRYYYTDDPQQAYDDQYYYYYNGKILIWGTEEYTQIR